MRAKCKCGQLADVRNVDGTERCWSCNDAYKAGQPKMFADAPSAIKCKHGIPVNHPCWGCDPNAKPHTVNPNASQCPDGVCQPSNGQCVVYKIPVADCWAKKAAKNNNTPSPGGQSCPHGVANTDFCDICDGSWAFALRGRV